MKVAFMDLNIVQGADINDFSVIPTFDDDSPVDLSGFDARLQIRSSVDSSSILDELTTDNGRIVISSYVEDGDTFYSIDVKFPNEDTSSYDFLKGVYDLEIFKSGSPDTDVDRLLQGSVTVSREVTR